MQRYLLFLLACHLAFAQTDAIAVLLKQKNLSNVPLKCQDHMQLGTVFHMRTDGSKTFECSDPSAMAVSLPSISPETPVAVGMDVVVLAYWKQPDGSVTFDYDTPRHPPIFP